MVFNRESEAVFELAMRALPALRAEFGPEEKSRTIVLQKLAERQNILCPHCKHDNKITSTELRMFLCCRCRKEIWVTARTQFHKAKLFFARLAILRLQEMGICINPNQASKLLGVSYSAVSNIYKQMGITVQSRFPENACEIITEFAISVVSRRTRFTPAEKPAFEEEFEMQKKFQIEETASDSDLLDNSALPNLTELELLILELVSKNPVSFDELVQKINADCRSVSVGITFLELRGIIERRVGNLFARANSFHLKNKKDNDRQRSLSESFCSFVRDYFQGVGRKNLQIYSSFHWLAYDRKTWSINTLRDLFIDHPYVSYQEILDYVTPPTFKIVARYDSC